MEKFKQAYQAFVEALEDYGIIIQERDTQWMSMKPSIEQRSESAKGAFASDTYSQEAYDAVAAKLHDAGFVLDYQTDADTNYKTRVWAAPGVTYRLLFRVEQNVAYECARLKARLAELGCHY